MTTFSRRGGVELTRHPGFGRRIRRLVRISAVALGIIWALVMLLADTSNAAPLLVGAGWLTMPTLLAVSLKQPAARYLLIIPAALVAAGLGVVVATNRASATEALGWWLLLAGVLLGASLGAWFWYRWLPVPTAFHQPFSPGRWALITVHAGAILLGVGLILGAQLT